VAAILEAAAHCFSQRGFTATTLADIGRELGLRKSIVHYYFTSKATLVQEVQSFAYGRYLQVIRSALAGGGLTVTDSSVELTPSEPNSLTRGLQSLWDSLRQNGSLRGLNLELWSEGRRNDELASRATTLEGEAHALVRDHFLGHSKATPEKADALATLTLAVLDGLNVREEREGPSERTHQAFDKFLELLDNCAQKSE
jgi:AcrR family transcriptional regulator